jgi:pimeloyl-ACP methyl ester carboxylesterase
VCPQAPSVPGLVFPATDGTHLFGAVLGHGPVGVVMANDVPHSLCEEIPESVFLSHHGFRVLVFDYRGHGESEAGPDRGRLDLDVEGAAAELRRLGANRVVVLGFYAGGAVALVASLRIDPPVSAVVAVSPAGRRGQFVNGPYTAPGALAIAPRVHSPALFLLVRTDRFVPLSEGRRLYALTGSDDKRLAVFPYGGGGLVLFDLSTFADRANAAVVGFIRAHTA